MKTLSNLAINLFLGVLFCLPAFGHAQGITLGTIFDSDNRQAGTYRRNDAMQEGSSESCKVMSARTVKLEAGNTAKAIGASAGAIFGSGATKGLGASLGNGNVQTEISSLGAIGGAIGGNLLVNAIMSDAGEEYILNCNGRAKTVVQEADKNIPMASRGMEVFVMNQGGRTRVLY